MQEELLNNTAFKEFIDAFVRLSKDSKRMSIEENRKASTRFFLPSNTVYEKVKKVRDDKIPIPSQHKIPVRIFIPDDSKPLPLIVYFHRGGWVFGNLEEADPVCRKLANHIGAVVMAVEYRLAPENPFPIPLEDCFAATQWAAEHASQFSADNNRLIVLGESAGGNLAAAVALMAKEFGGPKIAAQVLIYPAIDSKINDKAYKDCQDQQFLTRDAMIFFWDAYLQRPENYTNPFASPNLAPNLHQMPPALIITAEHDPLKQEAEQYGLKLSRAGNQVVLRCFPSVIHGFIDLPCYDEVSKIKWIKEIGRQLQSLIQ